MARLKEVRPRGHFLTVRHQVGVVPDRFAQLRAGPKVPAFDVQGTKMRRLEEYEEIGLIGYPRDGDYIAVLGGPKRQSWLLGGELCGLDGAALADQAACLPRYYPQGSRLVLVTITDNWVIALRDYDTAAIGQHANC